MYISGAGTPEAVQVTGGTCRGDNQPGSLEFTAVNHHPAGYVVGSASTGLAKEALIATHNHTQNHFSSGQETVNTGLEEINIYARVSIRISNLTIDFSGAVFNCYADDTCIFCGVIRKTPL